MEGFEHEQQDLKLYTLTVTFYLGEEDLFYTEKNKSQKIHRYFAKSIYTYNQY